VVVLVLVLELVLVPFSCEARASGGALQGRVVPVVPVGMMVVPVELVGVPVELVVVPVVLVVVPACFALACVVGSTPAAWRWPRPR
jgi:hypothetical protein